MIKPFSITSRVYYQDTDAGGVIYHSRYLDFCERARTEFLRERGIVQTELRDKENVIFIVRNLSIEYVASGKLDDLLEITVEIKKMSGVRIFMEQKVLRKDDEKLLAKVNLELASVNRNLRPTKLPKNLREKLNN